MSEQTWRRGSSFWLVVIGALVLVGLLVGARATKGTPMDFTSENPAVGNQDNTDPVFSTVQSWPDLVTTVEKQDATWYKQCLESRIGVTWEQAQKFAQFVNQGHDLRFILVSNSSVSDEYSRQMLRDQGIRNVDNLPIRRVNGFENTRGLAQDRCQAFGDGRHQVRISLAVPVDPNDITKGVHDDRGVLGMCSNPWKETPPTTSTTTPPTTMPSSTTTMPSPTTTTMPTTVPPTTTTTTTPTTRKPPQSDDCMLNGGSNCPPNGGNQPLQDNGTSGVNVGVPTSEASPTDRPQGDPSGDSGSGDAPPPTGPTDNSDSDQSTTVDNQQPCPLGPGNC